MVDASEEKEDEEEEDEIFYSRANAVNEEDPERDRAICGSVRGCAWALCCSRKTGLPPGGYGASTSGKLRWHRQGHAVGGASHESKSFWHALSPRKRQTGQQQQHGWHAALLTPPLLTRLINDDIPSQERAILGRQEA